MNEENKTFLIHTWVWRMVSIFVAVIVAVLITVYLGRDNQIEFCVASGNSRIIDANFFHDAAVKNESVARNSKDPAVIEAQLKAAKQYYGYEIAKRETIPMPHNWSGDPKTRGDNRDDRVAGCEDAFPPPIPFIN